jgi:hypothetical protein
MSTHVLIAHHMIYVRRRESSQRLRGQRFPVGLDAVPVYCCLDKKRYDLENLLRCNRNVTRSSRILASSRMFEAAS